MASKTPAAAVCTKCYKYDELGSRINLQCSEQVNGKRCKGVWGSTLNNSDWIKCPHCKGGGCQPCQQTSWMFIRR
jgi:hypothetical protein